jgi:hypothetical protein
MIESTPEEHIPEDKNETTEMEIPVYPPKEVTVFHRDGERERNHTSFPSMWR